MPSKKREHPKEKVELHKRNKHRNRYNFKELIKTCPELTSFVAPNKYGDESINFFNPEAVKMLNKALLQHYYGIDYWDVPKGYLCPPIPGRADYIHYIADLLAAKYDGDIPKGKKIVCLDVGVGANCVYPIIGNKEYGWSFVGTDIDEVAVNSATKIVEENKSLSSNVTIRLQENKRNFFQGIIKSNEKIDVTICNPPFHASAADAMASTRRKVKNLTNKKVAKPVLNFGGQSNELWCKGGELKFVQDMIYESRKFGASCLWFTTLISKESNLNTIYKLLEKVNAVEVKTQYMGQGNKISRIVAWTFLEEKQHKEWVG